MNPNRISTLKTVYRRDRAEALAALNEAQSQVEALAKELEAVRDQMARVRDEIASVPVGTKLPAGRLASHALNLYIKRSELDRLTAKEADLTDQLQFAKIRERSAQDEVARTTKALNTLPEIDNER